MDLALAGRVGIVTGASRGIGRAIAVELAREGVRLAIVARSADGLAETAAAAGGECLALRHDLRAPDAAAAVVASTIARFGRLDLLVNNAGATPRGDFLVLDDAAWSDGFALKFFGAMRLAREAWPHLAAVAGAIVNIAGVGGRTGSADFTVGGSVNAALLNLTKALADRGCRDGVRVNAVNPGWIETARLRGRLEAAARERGVDEAAAARALATELGVRRFGQPEEIARVVAFLASPRAEYVQGSVLDVDGGLTRTL